jgi:arylsulfatase A-like enzyme
VIIFTADHGEAFGQHGSVWHARTLYQEELHIPLMMYAPGVPSGGHIKEPVSSLDYAPTILALEGVPVPSSFIGKSLIPLLDGGTLGPRVLPFENGFPYFLLKPSTSAPASLAAAGAANSSLPVINQEVIGVRMGDYKLIYGSIDRPKPLELYNLASDPGERDDLLDTNGAPPGVIDTLISAFRSIIQKYPK